MELFRREALDGQDRLHGEVVFVPQISWKLLAAFFAASLAVGALFLLTADHRSATPVSGRLADGGDGALIALFDVPAQAAEAIAPGRPLLVSVSGSQRRIDARVAAVTPSGDGRATVRAVLPAAAGDVPFPPAGTTVRAPLPARSRSLGAWLFDAFSGRDRE